MNKGVQTFDWYSTVFIKDATKTYRKNVKHHFIGIPNKARLKNKTTEKIYLICLSCKDI